MLHCKSKTYLRLATSAAFRGFPGGAGTRIISGVIFLGLMKKGKFHVLKKIG